MVKYIVKETIDWEGYQQWTVFANSPEHAKRLVEDDSRYTGEKLEIVSSKSAKGTNRARIHKYSSNYDY